MKKNLAIIFFKELDADLGDYLVKNLFKIFKNLIDKIELLRNSLKIPQKSYFNLRNQYLSSPLLEELRTLAIENDYYKILGIISGDLFTEGLNFIFGQAEFGNPEETRAAIISTYRLISELKIMNSNKLFVYRRILKECIHELGHTLELSHCNNICVMKFSNSLVEADEKPLNFCKTCQNKLQSIK